MQNQTIILSITDEVTPTQQAIKTLFPDLKKGAYKVECSLEQLTMEYDYNIAVASYEQDLKATIIQ